MASDGGKSRLPSAPSTLCFDKDEFMKENFSIDRFVSECRKHVQLDTLREDLGLYLRLLSSAMIDLINQDYADFVNLSSNLVGLDTDKLTVPLGQLKEEVKSVKGALDDTVCSIDAKLKQRKKIRETKMCLQLQLSSVQCIERIENLLNLQNEDPAKNRLSNLNVDGNLMERIANEFNRLEFLQSKGLSIVEKMKPRISRITADLEKSLEEYFLSSLKSNDTEGLRQCLRIYATVDKARNVENLFRRQLVAPYMESVINETALKSNPQGLKGMYARVLEFIPKHCGNLKIVAQSAFSGDSAGGVVFLVNSIWPEIVAGIEVRTPVLWDLTNPKAFHERYTTTLQFLEKFEEECDSLPVITRLRQHPSYSAFLNKWNLAVYFQIRFQEIAGQLESSLSKPSPEVEKGDGKEFVLVQTNRLWDCLHACWSPDVYLRPLTHKFWKLTLLLVSRYSTWLRETFEANDLSAGGVGPANACPPEIGSNERAVNGLAPKSVEEPSSGCRSMLHIVALAADVHRLSLKIPGFVDEVVSSLVRDSAFDAGILNESGTELASGLASFVPRLGQTVIESISSQCCGNLKSVYDIPRLFRRTNREVPTKPSTYVTSTLKPLLNFLSDHRESVPEPCQEQWVCATMTNIADQYLTVTREVLTSVKKMEDSLKRLKKAREKPNSGSVGNSGGISDDDKIRLQLALDVEYLGKQITSLGVDGASISSFVALSELVESARSSPGPS